MLSLRIASGVVAVPLLAVVAYLGGLVYGLVLVAACLAAAWEIGRMLQAGGRRPFRLVLYGVAGTLPFAAWFRTDRTNGNPLLGGDAMVLLTILLVASLLLVLLRREREGAITDWALSFTAALYIGGLMQFYAPLRDRPDGALWAMATVGLSFVCDTSAYFAGRSYGRTQLAPSISPKKTVEGAAVGLVLPAIVGAVVGWTVTGNALHLAGFGFAIAVATVIGDLAESLFKRQTGVKDSGDLIPGHGGLLDRMDSLLFCAPVAVLYLHVFGAP